MKALRAVSILLLLTLVNCTEKGKPIVQHQEDTRRSPPAVSTQVDPQTAVVPVAKDFDALAARVLDQARIRDLRSYSNRQVSDELKALNEQLIRGDRKRILPVLKNYVSSLRLECGEIKASCLGLKYFKMAASSAEVAKMMAQMPEFAEESTDLLLYSAELKNGLADTALLRLMIEKVPAANATLRSMLETALMSSAEKLRDEAPLREFLGSVKAWDLVHNKKWDLSPAAQNALWSMIARSRLMYDADGKLGAEFKRISQQLQAEPGSFMFEQKSILDKKVLKPEAMGAQVISNFDELYFLADAVYLQKISPNAASDLFLNSRRSPKDLAETIENYARMRFVIALVEGNLIAKTIFQAAIPGEQLLVHTMRQSSLVRQVWGTMETRLQVLKAFGTAALKQVPGGAELEPKMRAAFNSYGRSVNLVSAYPHTLLLFQKLSANRFKLRLRIVGEVDTGSLIPMLFLGTIPPLLDYSDETAPLNHFEILHAFDMAVRSRMLNTMGVDPDEFMSDIVSRLYQNPVKLIEPTLDRVEKRFIETKYFRELENICGELKGGPAIPRVIDLPAIRRSPYFGNVMDKLYTGMSSRGERSTGGGAVSEVELGLFYSDGEYTESVEMVRLDLQQQERVALAMLRSYSGYLKKFEGKSDEEIAKLTAKTRAQIERMTKLRERTMRTASEWFERIGWCYFQAGMKDYESYHQVLKLEEEHLRSVFRSIQRLRAGNLSAEEQQRIVESHQFRGLPSNFKGLDRVDKNGYVVSSIDFIIRSAQHIQKISPNIRINYGSELNLDVEAVRLAEIRSLPYTDDEQAFVDSAMQAYFSKRDAYVIWMSLAGDRLNMWQHFLKGMISNYRLEMETYGQAKTFTPARILQAHEEILKMTILTADDRRLMGTLREQTRFDALSLDQSLMKYTYDMDKGKYELQDIWSLYDLPVKLINYEKLGFDYDQATSGSDVIPAAFKPKRFGYMELGKIYYGARSAATRGNPLIPYNAELDSELDARVTSTVREGIRATRAFHKYTTGHLAEISRRPAPLRPRADINTHMSITNLLSDNLIPSYEADLNRFRQTTQDCFLNRCADFK